MVLSVVPPVRTGTSTTESMGGNKARKLLFSSLSIELIHFRLIDIDVVALAKEWCVAEYELLRAIAPVEFHKQV